MDLEVHLAPSALVGLAFVVLIYLWFSRGGSRE